MKTPEQAKTPQKASVNESPKDFLQKLDSFLEKRLMAIFFICLGLSALFGIWLFDGRLSFATDDATYIGNAINFLQHKVYPTYQGALYPFFLALIIHLFGLKLITLKAFSMVFQLVNVLIFYRSFKGRVPGFILFCGLITLSINSFILAYASATFTESFFMLMQSLTLWAIFILVEHVSRPDSVKVTLKYWLLAGFMLFLLSISKNAALFAPMGLVLYFGLRKEWKYVLMLVVAFALFKGTYELVARSIFGNITSSQVDMLLLKKHDDPSQGKVSTGDLVERFTENFGNYISVHTYKMLGFRGPATSSLFSPEKVSVEVQPANPDDKIESSAFLSLVFIILYGIALWMSYLNNRFLFVVFLYVGVMAGATFIVLQAYWNQDRLMVIFLPYIFMAMMYALYAFVRYRKWDFLQPFVLVFGAICILLQFAFTFKQSGKQKHLYAHALKGDIYYGYPEEIANYLHLADWTYNNVPPDAVIAASKPVEAKVFGKMLRFVRPSLPKTAEADTVLHALQQQQVSYMMLDATGGSTVAAYKIIYQKYPAKLQIVHTEGGEETGAALIKINY